jgi:hypothetical protein
MLIEADLPKDEARLKRFVTYNMYRNGLAKKHEKLIDERARLTQEGSLTVTQWADNTGHIIGWWAFANMDAFAKLWSLDEWHNWLIEIGPLYDNMRIRLLRPGRSITEDMIPY